MNKKFHYMQIHILCCTALIILGHPIIFAARTEAAEEDFHQKVEATMEKLRMDGGLKSWTRQDLASYYGPLRGIGYVLYKSDSL